LGIPLCFHWQNTQNRAGQLHRKECYKYCIIICVKLFRIFEIVVWCLSPIKCPLILGILKFPLLPLKFVERKIWKHLVIFLNYSIVLYIKCFFLQLFFRNCRAQDSTFPSAKNLFYFNYLFAPDFKYYNWVFKWYINPDLYTSFCPCITVYFSTCYSLNIFSL
jgi:hypothetical protein